MYFFNVSLLYISVCYGILNIRLLCKPFTIFIYRDIKITCCTSKQFLKNYTFEWGKGRRRGGGEGKWEGEGKGEGEEGDRTPLDGWRRATRRLMWLRILLVKIKIFINSFQEMLKEFIFLHFF
jgi:hypothetical protein